METTRLHGRRREARPVLGMALLDGAGWGAPGSPAFSSKTPSVPVVGSSPGSTIPVVLGGRARSKRSRHREYCRGNANRVLGQLARAGWPLVSIWVDTVKQIGNQASIHVGVPEQVCQGGLPSTSLYVRDEALGQTGVLGGLGQGPASL